MIEGIGIDIIELAHMQGVLDKSPRIYKKFLTPKELEVYKTFNKQRQLEFLAGRFAAKEAFSKAMGTGIGRTTTFQNITVLNNEKGTPYIEESPFYGKVHVSISHSQTVVVAQVVLENILIE